MFFVVLLLGLFPGFVRAFFLREKYAKENEKREKKVKHENSAKDAKGGFAHKASDTFRERF